MGRIDDFWQGKNYLMYGFSRDPKSFGRLIYRKLTQVGVKLTPIRKDIDEIDSIKMTESPAGIPDEVDGAYIAVNPKAAPEILEELKENGINRVFLQLGAFNKDIINQLEESGFEYETGCALTRFDKMGFPHSTHRWVAKTLGGMKI